MILSLPLVDLFRAKFVVAGSTASAAHPLLHPFRPWCGEGIRRCACHGLTAMRVTLPAFPTSVFQPYEGVSSGGMIGRTKLVSKSRGSFFPLPWAQHNDLEPRNVTKSPSGPLIIDFDRALLGHKCSGASCKELLQVTQALDLEPAAEMETLEGETVTPPTVYSVVVSFVSFVSVVAALF
ncbi:hypothetical protein B0H14DRAFT_2572140 [Mycena olivaceomarginata]|nr:hypothetical protein B0H14DRAFT_2572140 [Mycena olivaceomarginata]